MTPVKTTSGAVSVGGRTWWLLVALLATLALLASACGSRSDDDEGAVDDTEPAAETAETAPVEEDSFAPIPEDPEVTAVDVDLPCLVPGEEQTLRVRGTPGTRILFQAIYAGEVTAMHPDYPGGNERGAIPESGELVASWTVEEPAPAGPVRVDVTDVFNAPTGEGRHTTEFRVADAGDGC